MSERKPGSINCDPRGWWFNEGRIANQWSGPFDTPEEAEKMARMLAPDSVEVIKLLQVQAWEKREVRIKGPNQGKCPHCKNGFVSGQCCLKCEGTGRAKK